MSENTQLVKFKSLMANDAVKAKFNEILGNNGNAFISSVVTLATTSKLQECEPNSILSCAITAATLNLQINPNLGFACIIPYKNKDKMVAQFQVMAKGLLQLALRSGQFKTINVVEVYDGELQFVNKLTGEISLSGERKNNKIVGYCSYFELLNGFSKTLYMTVEEINEHAKKFSKTYTFSTGAWSTNFEGMARKTVLKLILSRYAPLSVEMERAILADQAVIQTPEGDSMDFTQFTYVDNEVEINEEESAKKTKSAQKITATIEKELTDKLEATIVEDNKKQSELFNKQ